MIWSVFLQISAQFVDTIPCDEDCEQFTYAVHQNAVRNTVLCNNMFLSQFTCTFNTNPLLQSVYFATYRYNNEASSGTTFNLLNGNLPPPYMESDEQADCVAGKIYHKYNGCFIRLIIGAQLAKMKKSIPDMSLPR